MCWERLCTSRTGGTGRGGWGGWKTCGINDWMQLESWTGMDGCKCSWSWGGTKILNVERIHEQNIMQLISWLILGWPEVRGHDKGKGLCMCLLVLHDIPWGASQFVRSLVVRKHTSIISEKGSWLLCKGLVLKRLPAAGTFRCHAVLVPFVAMQFWSTHTTTYLPYYPCISRSLSGCHS